MPAIGLSIVQGAAKAGASYLMGQAMKSLLGREGTRVSEAWYSATEDALDQSSAFALPASPKDLRSLARVPVDTMRPECPLPTAELMTILVSYECFCAGAKPDIKKISVFCRRSMRLWASFLLRDETTRRLLIEVRGVEPRTFIADAMAVPPELNEQLSEFTRAQDLYFQSYANNDGPDKLTVTAPGSPSVEGPDRQIDLACWSIREMSFGFFRKHHNYDADHVGIVQAVENTRGGVERGVLVGERRSSGHEVIWEY